MREPEGEEGAGPRTHWRAAHQVFTHTAPWDSLEIHINPPDSLSPDWDVAMFRAALQNVDLFWLILFSAVFLPETGCGSADVDSCHEVKTAYMMRQIGPVELVPDRPGTGQSLPVEISWKLWIALGIIEVVELYLSIYILCHFTLILYYI